jgi:hypothetical protein
MDQLAAEPCFLAEARSLAPELRRLAAPCGGDAVKDALKALVLVYGLGEQAKSPAFWQIYVKALEDLPGEAVREACEDYARQPDSQFFPKPGPLRDLAMKRAAVVLRMAGRATQAASMCARPVYVPPGPAEKARVRAMLGDYLAATKRVPDEKAIRPNHGKTDERGLTAEMRAHIEARAA